MDEGKEITMEDFQELVDQMYRDMKAPPEKPILHLSLEEIQTLYVVIGEERFKRILNEVKLVTSQKGADWILDLLKEQADVIRIPKFKEGDFG